MSLGLLYTLKRGFDLNAKTPENFSSYYNLYTRAPAPLVGTRTSLRVSIFYLCTRAPAPPMIPSTSFLLAMVVSPGVVIANAP